MSNTPPVQLKNGILYINDDAQIIENANGTWTISSPEFNGLILTAAQVNSITEIRTASADVNLTFNALAVNNENFRITGAGSVDITGVNTNEATPTLTVESNVTISGIRFENTGGTTVDGSRLEYFATRWENLDDYYVQIANTPGVGQVLFGDDGYTDPTVLSSPILGHTTAGAAALAVNQAFLELGLEYAQYLAAGGEAFNDFTVKANGSGRDQSLHDNLLGNITAGAINDRQLPDPIEASWHNRIDDVWENRPYFDGNPSSNEQATFVYDWNHGVNRTDYFSTVAEGRADARALDGQNLIIGSGNPGTSGYVVRHNGEASEIFIDANVRQGPQSPYYLDGAGHIHWQVPDGTQLMANGSQSDNPTRGAFSVQIAVTDDELRDSDFAIRISFDRDLTENTSYNLNNSLYGRYVGNDPAGDQNGFVFFDRLGNAVILDNEGTDQSVQQSLNPIFNYWRNSVDGNPDQFGTQTWNLTGGELGLRVEVFEGAVWGTNNRVNLVGANVVNQSEVFFDIA